MVKKNNGQTRPFDRSYVGRSTTLSRPCIHRRRVLFHVRRCGTSTYLQQDQRRKEIHLPFSPLSGPFSTESSLSQRTSGTTFSEFNWKIVVPRTASCISSLSPCLQIGKSAVGRRSSVG